MFQSLSQVALLTKCTTRFVTIFAAKPEDETAKMSMLINIIKWLYSKVSLLGGNLSKLDESEAREDLICDMDAKV